MKRASLYIGGVVVLLSLLAISFVGGIAFGEVTELGALLRPAQADESDLGERVEEVQRLLDRQALEPASEESATAGAVAGLLESLDDPYAIYFNPDHFKYFNEQNEGEFFGIGVTITEREGVVFVVNPIEGTPAEEAGLKADDEFVTIDDVTRDEWTTEEVVKRVRGPEGTTVSITVRRPDASDAEAEGELLDFTITRARIDIPNTMSEIEGEVGYIRLMGFNAHATEEIATEITELEEQGARAFVLDLRDNPGGLLDSSIDVASLFIKDGVIVRVEERDRPQIEHRATGRFLTDKPLVILMNGNSASASEVLAGALQDYGRALLVGEQSFGKGSVQTVERLSFGGGIKYTIAHYLTPKERVIDGIGLTPDITVEMDAELQRDPETDTQRARAIEEARKQL